MTTRPAIAFAAALAASTFAGTPALPQEGASLFGARVASVTYGPYIRMEAGAGKLSLSDAYWLPPGDADPRVNFDPSPAKDTLGFGAVALGYDWQNGVRADVSIFGTGTTDLTAPCSSVADATPCSEHSDITDASVSTTGMMANVFYAPFEARGSNAVFQPFIVAGIGLARNKMGDWTRTKNPDNPTVGSGTVRTFEGATSTGLAWSVGIGASYQVTRPGRWPVIVEATLRHYDFGEASGGVSPVGSGSDARKGFTLRRTDQVFTLGVRIPLRRY